MSTALHILVLPLLSILRGSSALDHFCTTTNNNHDHDEEDEEVEEQEEEVDRILFGITRGTNRYYLLLYLLWKKTDFKEVKEVTNQK